jgi:hypothetical protein
VLYLTKTGEQTKNSKKEKYINKIRIHLLFKPTIKRKRSKSFIKSFLSTLQISNDNKHKQCLTIKFIVTRVKQALEDNRQGFPIERTFSCGNKLVSALIAVSQFTVSLDVNFNTNKLLQFCAISTNQD